MGLVYMSTIEGFSTIYVSISTNIRCFVDDIKMNVAHLNENIEHGIDGSQSQLIQFTDLHIHCYK